MTVTNLPHGISHSKLPIINAKKPLTVHVLAGDIKKADVKEPQNCAVALACKRELGAQEVHVHLGRVYIRSNESNWVRYGTPKSMRAEIIAFDRGGVFEPGTFRLEVPAKRTPASNVGTRKARGKHGQYRKNLKRHIITNVRTGPAI